MKRAAVMVGLIAAAILAAALCYAAGFIEGYELGQRVALLPPFCATAANGIATLTSLSGSGTIGDPTVEGFTRIDITTDMASGGADTTVDGKTVKTGNVSMDVVNKAGTELPTTGGIGTTIFYTLGAILVLDAAILLVTKKRMTAEN